MSMHERFGAGLIAGLLAFGGFGALVAGPRPAEAASKPLETNGGALALTYCDNFCTLTVKLGGNGTGTWQSTNINLVPDGLIDCHMLNGVQGDGQLCSHSYPGPRDAVYTIYYLMTAASGSDACDYDNCDTSVDSLVTLSGALQLTHDSFRLKPYTVDVSSGGTGSGSVFSTPGGIACGATCTFAWDYGTSILLTAIPAQGSTFTGWTGACTGQPADCLIAIIEPTTIKALFKASAVGATPRPTKAPAPSQATPTTAASDAAASPGQSEVISSPDAATVAPTSTPGPSIEPTTGSTDRTSLLILVLVIGGLFAVAVGFTTYRLASRRR